MRTFHRITMMFTGLFVLYVAVTGSLMQSVDITTIMWHQPATNANMQSCHETLFATKWVKLNRKVLFCTLIDCKLCPYS